MSVDWGIWVVEERPWDWVVRRLVWEPVGVGRAFGWRVGILVGWDARVGMDLWWVDFDREVWPVSSFISLLPV